MPKTATSVTVETMYWLPYCSTCVKADEALKKLGIQVNNYINVKEEKVTKATIEKLVKLIGGADKLFSKRAMKYRSMGLDKMDLSEEDMINYMVEEYTFIRRPVIVTTEKQILAGFSEKQYKAL